MRTIGLWMRHLCVLALAGGLSAAGAFTQGVIFGDSASDSGNNTIFLGIDARQVITGNDYIPTQPYASGRYSNGEVWTAPFAAAQGFGAVASLQGGTVWAYGGARTRVPSPSGAPSLRDQVQAWWLQQGGVADPEALYVVAGGGNNVRDTLDELSAGAPLLPTVLGDARRFAADIAWILDRLYAAGARHVVVWNTPDLAQSPAIIANGPEAVAAAKLVIAAMNKALARRLDAYPEVHRFDVFALYGSVIGHPADHGLDNVTDACGARADCDPEKYLFWDGIHPTSAGHRIIGRAMLKTAERVAAP